MKLYVAIQLALQSTQFLLLFGNQMEKEFLPFPWLQGKYNKKI